MKKNDISKQLESVIDEALGPLKAQSYKSVPKAGETGAVVSAGSGIAVVTGLPGLGTGELVSIGGAMAVAFDLEPGEAKLAVLSGEAEVRAGSRAVRLGRSADVPVGEALLGRVVDPLGRPLDNGPEPAAEARLPVERPSPAIMDRQAVSRPMQTGITAIDALIPIGRGQRELIIGDRQTGKTAIAVDAIINQRGKNMICVYCAIGRQASSVAGVVETLRSSGAMNYSIVVAAAGNEPAALSFLTPYAASSMAEYFMERGRDALIVYDDLTSHARAYRELSLLMRRPPAREAFPGDIFYIHSRLLERSTQLSESRGAGSMTALPIVETEAQNLAAYIPTNIVSITDGQIYLSPKLFREGVLPAVDVGKSVSRVGGAAQLPAFRAVAGNLKLSYSQFEELEIFERFSTRLDETTKQALNRGHKIRNALKQQQSAVRSAAEQVIILLAVTSGVFDLMDEKQAAEAAVKAWAAVSLKAADECRLIEKGAELTPELRGKILEIIKSAVKKTGGS